MYTHTILYLIIHACVHVQYSQLSLELCFFVSLSVFLSLPLLLFPHLPPLLLVGQLLVFERVSQLTTIIIEPVNLCIVHV